MAQAQDDSGAIVGINVTPLVDITLVLLIIFMVTAKIIATPALPLDLPQASQGTEIQVVFSVLVPARGITLVDGQAASDDGTFLHLAQAALEKNRDVRAVIQADGSVAHRRVVHLIDLLRRVGISRIALGIRPLDEAEPGAP